VRSESATVSADAGDLADEVVDWSRGVERLHRSGHQRAVSHRRYDRKRSSTEIAEDDITGSGRERGSVQAVAARQPVLSSFL
jgi:hypothetical protein